MEQDSPSFQRRSVNSKKQEQKSDALPEKKKNLLEESLGLEAQVEQSSKSNNDEHLRPVAPAVLDKPATDSSSETVPSAPDACDWPRTDDAQSESGQHSDWRIRSIEEDEAFYSPEVTEKILAYLADLDLLSADQIKLVQQEIDRSDLDLVQVIVQKKFMKESQIGQAVATYFGCSYLNFDNISIRPELMALVPKRVCAKNGLVVFDEAADLIKVAMVDPERLHLVHLIEKKTGKRAQVHCTTPSQIEHALKNYTGEFEDKFQSLMARASQNLAHLDSLDSISQIFDTLVLMAFQRGSSDVHIEPLEGEIRIRFRIDGVLQKIVSLPTEFLETINNHIKVLAHLRTDTHNAFQDGRFQVSYEDATINFRVSIMPTHYGEKIVLRLLSTDSKKLSLADLGYQESDQQIIEGYITKSNGMILTTGPTGSGKTTTLYAMIKELNQEGVNISTIEDPIEYGLAGINQTQVDEKTNITFAEGLKSLLRQDPDILMIGEVRDFETGKVAVNSALTGHLVFSTLHTNNAALAPLRLLQMGIDPYLVVNTVDLIIAQRLVRKICSACITSFTLSADEVSALKKQYVLRDSQQALFDKYFVSDNSDELRFYKGAGCSKCGDSGFKGRLVIAELLEMKDNIAELILQSATESKIQETAEANGMITMLEDGIQKVLDGQTTLEEILRVINQ